jgi:rhamnose utilization protein RhaD (predicted bifunctional aldolase and dehydrogenase)/NAD(P)-dependent dehydrogenase (short-subunit alcohol dehydrogenase family)
MKTEIRDLIDISRYYGKQKDYTLAGGGNTSFKDEKYIWVKASGAALATIDEEGFAVLDRKMVKVTGTKVYSADPQKRETEVKADLIAANIHPEKQKRPSVETSFHELIEYAFVVHMHPTVTNSLTCSSLAREKTSELFGEEAMYITYAPGYELFKKVQEAMEPYREKFGRDPKMIFLENHGVFVSADSIDEIRSIYDHITRTIKSRYKNETSFEDLPVNEKITEFVPAIRMILSENQPKITRLRHNSLHRHFYGNRKDFEKAALPFTPDIIVYCKGKYLYIEDSSSPEAIIEDLQKQLPAYKAKNGYNPKIIMIRDYGLLAVEDTAEAAEIALDVYEDLLKISYFSENFGGPHFLGEEDIAFIDNWEVENYRRMISKGSASRGLVEQRISIVTGGAQGFGAGIAETLVSDRANVVIADLNDETGLSTTQVLNGKTQKNETVYFHTDVSNPDSVKDLIAYTVKMFGGLDIYISNAGILKAGGLEEMDPGTFRKMTMVNYEAYYLGARYAAPVMKLQNRYKKDHFADIIQINSKSGLKGSNRNFAYAGGKFGSIGLTQSFALELAPHRIKVNSICPGNFFEGPLWSDPETGLFVQYLEAGKVPGAKTIEDVKRFYESQVPMERGCRTEDVMKALYYLIDQKYETGQALPVTGGQIMLN